MNLMGREYLLWGSKHFDFAEYDTVEKEMSLPWQKTPLFHWRTVREVESAQRQISSDEAMAQAEDIARKEAMKKIPKDAEVVDESFRYLGEENGAVGVEITIETKEELGIFREIEE